MVFTRRLACLAAVIASFQIASAQGQQPESLTIVGVTVIDTINGGVLPDRNVTIRGGEIVDIMSGALASGVRQVDGRGKFLIPGLWDMHAHHQLTGEGSLPLFVATGVTGTRDMGADLDFILPLRARVSSGAVLGPRIVVAGPILDDAPPEWPFRLRVRSADDGRRAVRLLKERGVDFIKVHTSTPAVAYSAIAEEARLQNIPFAGHVPRNVTVEQAAASGQRSIEHLDSGRMYTRCSGGQGYSSEKCADFFKWLASTKMWQTPTLVNWRKMFILGTPMGDSVADHFDYASPQVREFLDINREMSRITEQGVRDMVSMSQTSAVAVTDMQKAGIPILAGCDGMVAGFCLHDELALMVEGGMSPAAALQTATINAARYLELENSLGSIEVGKSADLVLLNANPLADVKNIGRIEAVMMRGQFFSRQQLDEILEKVRTQFKTGAAVEAR